MYLIYKILCSTNGKVYVGCCKSLYERRKLHLVQLKKGIHHSPKLQSDYDKYGRDSFSFIIIEDNVSIELTGEREAAPFIVINHKLRCNLLIYLYSIRKFHFVKSIF